MANVRTIAVPNQPAIKGLHFRSFQGESDYAQMAAVHAGAQAWDRIDPCSAREQVPSASDLAGMFSIAIAQQPLDLLIVEHNHQIIGYSHVFWNWTEITDVEVFLHLGYLLPAWRNQGIGSAMLRWAQSRIRAAAGQRGARANATLATNVSSTEREAERLMINQGYTAVRRLSDMVLEPIPAYPNRGLPSGVELRPVAPSAYRAIYEAWKDAFSTLWTSTPPSDEDFQSFVAMTVNNQYVDASLCRVAWAADHVVGLVWVDVKHNIAYFPEVAVRRAWQRQGIAHTLMGSALNAIRERGISQARLYTDADDGEGARSLYEQLGFRETKQHIFYRKPLSQPTLT